jgi:hypothetical protein
MLVVAFLLLSVVVGCWSMFSPFELLQAGRTNERMSE